MSPYYYFKNVKEIKIISDDLARGSFLGRIFPRLNLRLISIFFFSFGFGLLSWLAWPFLEWRTIYAPRFTDTEIKSPIPSFRGGIQTTAEAKGESGNLVYVRNWFPQAPSQASSSSSINHYDFSIPRLKINGVDVTIGGEDLSKSLIHWGGTALPGKNGTGVVFGHSVLPQFFDPKNYMTIFSTIHTLEKGDEIIVKFDGVEYTYQIFGFEIVDPSNTSYLEQKYDGAYLYLITCTPPGTYWKRLVVKAKLKNI